jgi:AcrR family transcriptional regulator
MASLPEHLMPLPSERRQLPREVMDRHQRDHILDAAVAVFAKRGYPATTVDHIVAAARIGVGSFYQLFDGKQDCFLRLFERILAEGRERIEVAIPDSAGQPEKVCAALRALLEAIGAEPLRARIVLVEAQTAGPKALARYEASIAQIVPELRRCRDASPLAAELPQTLELATLGGVVWFLQQRIVLSEIDDAPALLPELVEIVLEPYVGHEQAARLLASA